MKVFNTEQIRAWDQYTMQHEPVSSINLMERAAGKCFEWLAKNEYFPAQFTIFCGKGNNGGDGLALARMLAEISLLVTVYILEFGNKGTDDFQTNLARLHQYPAVDIHFVQDENNFHAPGKDAIIIDALFGSGLSRPLEGISARLVEHINQSGSEIISIDIPSGLSVDRSSRENIAIKATHTLCFQCHKPALLVAENAEYIGEVHILDIGLHPDFYSSAAAIYELIDEETISSIYKPRNRFSHKGNFGHALLVTGSYGKIGAAVLAARACLRSGVGLLTCHIPGCGYEIVQTAVPEAMVISDFNSSFISNIEFANPLYDAIGIGPGIGTASETRAVLKNLFSSSNKPLVLDADALNCLAMEKIMLATLPVNSLLTPHPKEFERIFGECSNDFDRLEKALKNAELLNCIIVLKGHHTFIALPGGKGYFNSTGNAGMATAGSGDVLTGIITGLLAQGYNSADASILGVYLHGLAGDFASECHSPEAMLAGDITDCLGKAFRKINPNQ
jgi:ADP-dependent NAD(P)H-hydrate dehydratase / NAD(P)H-hydrate epimerase